MFVKYSTLLILEKIFSVYSEALKFRFRKNEKLLKPSHYEDRCATPIRTNLVYFSVSNSTSKTK